MKEKSRKEKNYLKKKCFEKNHLNFAATLIVLTINAVLLTAVAVLLQQILDIAVKGTVKDIEKMLFMAVIYIVVLVLEGLAGRALRNRFVEKGMRQLKEAVFERITEKNITSFTVEPVGRYVSILTNDMVSVENNYLQNSFNIVLNILLFILALGIMLMYNVVLTLCAIGLVVVSLVVSLLSSTRLTKEEQKVSQSNEKYVSLVKDILSGFTVMKSFRAEKEIARLFGDENRSLEKQKCRRRKTEDAINLVSTTFGFGVHVGVMMTGAYLALQGKITAGVLIAFVQLMNYIIGPIQQIPAALANRKAAVGLLDKMLYVTKQSEQKDEGENITDIGRGICFQNVSFGYDCDQTVLKDINVFFEQGKSYAIVGASGSGKSTLLNLLMGGYTGYQGEILLGGRELRQISRSSLYDVVSLVEQNVFLFDSTIENNITMFKDFDKEKVAGAIQRAGLEKLVSERGIHYRCGENGSGLSGGEKQRISIARSLLRNASVLLLDEATSALDATTSAKVEDMIIRMTEMTRIVITHKLQKEVLARYDKILVMQNGNIIAKGSFGELEENCDYFRQLLFMK